MDLARPVSTTPCASSSTSSADLVDDPVVGGAQFEDPVAQVGVRGDRLDGASMSCLDRVAGSQRLDVLGLDVGVDGVDESADDVADGAPATLSSSSRSSGVSSSSSLASREARVAVSSSVRVRAAALSSSFFSVTDLSRLSGGSTKSCSVTPTASTMTNRVFAVASGVTAWKSAGGDGAGAAALHLLEVLRRADVAHEEHALQRLHVGAGGDHVDGDRDPQRRASAERLELALGVAGGVGDLGGEVVALAEHLPDRGDDLLGVVVVLGEDQRLRHGRCGRGRSR